MIGDGDMSESVVDDGAIDPTGSFAEGDDDVE